MRWRDVALIGALIPLGLLLAGCEEEESSGPTETNDGAYLPAKPKPVRFTESVGVPCEIGKRPGYFVPGPEDSPLAVLGCAHLGVSGKRVEFSAHCARIEGDLHSCINPAYSGRGRRGFYIPAVCKRSPPLSRFAIRDAAQPRQGVPGYAFVIWGTAGASTSDVVTHWKDGRVRAAVLPVRAGLARRFGEAPFSLFVVELPRAAACAPVTLHADGSGDTEQVPPRPKLCDRD